MVVDWSKIKKEDYLFAMERSPVKDTEIRILLQNALTDKTNDRQLFMKGIDTSYQYEGYNTYSLEELNKENSSQASSSIGKNVNEVEKETSNETKNEVTRIAINTTNMEKEDLATTAKPTEVKEEKKEEKVPDPVFTKPVEGEIVTEFASDKLVYSNTLQEWVTHNGIDIKADKTTVVKASEEGTVKSIKNDPRYGITVVIEHSNGYSSVYSNLLTAEFVKEKEKVKKGQTIGTVGNTATFEIADEAHLHFEILKNNEYVDPSQYIK